MPTERFYRLDNKKRTTISDAVLSEFQRTSFGEMKISKIARDAKISRGSLYTYFEGKEDMFVFALDEIWKKMSRFEVESLERNHGDYWAMLPESLEYRVRVGTASQLSRLFFFEPEGPERESLNRENSGSHRNLASQQMESSRKEHTHSLYTRLDRSWAACGEAEFQKVQDTCQALMTVAVQQILFRRKTEADAKQEFMTGIGLIRHQQNEMNLRGDRL